MQVYIWYISSGNNYRIKSFYVNNYSNKKVIYKLIIIIGKLNLLVII